MFNTTVWERIEGAGKNDPRAIIAFMSSYRGPLLSYVRRWSVPGAEPEDLVQDILVQLFAQGALQRADRARGSFRTFLLGVAKKVVLNARRKANTVKRGGGRQAAGLEDDVAAAAPTDEEFERLWRQHLLERALEALTAKNPRQREAVRLRFEEGRSYEDIAAQMGRNLQQVKNDLHRARLALTAAFEEAVAHYASSQEEFQVELEAMRAFAGLHEE